MVATRSILNSLSSDENCPFCLGNGKIPPEKVLATAWWGVLVEEHSQAVAGSRQIVPKWHKMTALRGILFLWSFFWLLLKHWPGTDFNLSINFGRDAGQTLPHLHVWIVPRYGDYAGKGFAHFVSLEATARRELGMTLAQLVEDRLGSEG